MRVASWLRVGHIVPLSREYYTTPMSQTNDYVLNCIKTWVWSGFCGPDDIQEMIGDVLEHDATKQCSEPPSSPSLP
jgi:hypothetical protein